MPQQPASDDEIVTLQARVIADLDERVAELVKQISFRDAQFSEQMGQRDETIAALEQRLRDTTELLAVYQRSRAVRFASLLRRLQPGRQNGAVRGRRTPER